MQKVGKSALGTLYSIFVDIYIYREKSGKLLRINYGAIMYNNIII